MNIIVISSSQRPHSQSHKVGEFITRTLNYQDSSATHIDLFELNLPFFNGDWEDNDIPAKGKEFANILDCADGFVYVTPEWNGGNTPILTNSFLYVSHKQLGHKPALIAALSAGRGGAMSINQVRTIGYKNTRLLFIPEHIIIREVSSVLNSQYPENKADAYIRDRIEYCCKLLISYAQAMNTLRNEFAFRYDDFPTGMS